MCREEFHNRRSSGKKSSSLTCSSLPPENDYISKYFFRITDTVHACRFKDCSALFCDAGSRRFEISDDMVRHVGIHALNSMVPNPALLVDDFSSIKEAKMKSLQNDFVVVSTPTKKRARAAAPLAKPLDAETIANMEKTRKLFSKLNSAGTTIENEDRDVLDDFDRTWRCDNPLEYSLEEDDLFA